MDFSKNNFLRNFQQHTIANQESYSDDVLLIGRLDICRNLLGFLTEEQIVTIGSEPNGTQLVKVILKVVTYLMFFFPLNFA